MEPQDIPDISASSSASLSSPAPAITPVIPTRKTRKAEEKLRLDLIAERKATKVTAAHAKIADELATRNAAREASNQRLTDAQQAADENAIDEAAVVELVLEVSDDRDKLLSTSAPKKSKAKTVDVEESPLDKPKRRKGNDKNIKRSTDDEVDNDEDSIESDPSIRRKSTRRLRVPPIKEDDSGSDDEKDDDDDDDEDKDANDNDDKETESLSADEYWSSDDSVESSAKKRRERSPPRHGKKFSTRKKVIIPSKIDKSGRSTTSKTKDVKGEKSKKTSITSKSKTNSSSMTSTSSKSKSKESESIKKRKLEEDDIDAEADDTSVLSDVVVPKQQTLINMNEVYRLTDEKLETDSRAAVRAFHDQAHLPNFECKWDQIITKNCLVRLRFRINTKKKILGYTQEQVQSWPTIGRKVLSIREISRDLDMCYSDASRSSNTVYDLNEVIRNYSFSYDYQDPSVEEKSISDFMKIVETYHPDGADLTAVRENEICKAFYKKLSDKDAFGIKFHEATKIALKGKKKDTIAAMYMRLSDHLSTSRQCVNDAFDLGNNKHKWSTPIDDPHAREAKRQRIISSPGPSNSVSFQRDEEPPKAAYKPIAKRQPEVPEYPGMDRITLQCHTCGRYGHNRYSCHHHMNAHCNNTHLPWAKSPMGIEFKRIGHSHFVPFIELNGETTKQYRANPIPAGFEYPTEDDDVDMGNTQGYQNQKQAKTSSSYGKGKKPAFDDRRKSELTLENSYIPVFPRIDLPRTRTLLSAIHPDKVKDYLQVHISLPQINMALAPTTATLLMPTTETATANATSERPSRATKRKKKTARPTAPASPTPSSRGMDALAQIDTGCQVGDVINRRVLEGLRGEHRLRDSDSPMWICSGLDNQCIESKSVLDIVVSFKKDSLKYIFSLPVRIAQDSELDLILGIDTIKNLNLVQIIPEFFGHKNSIDPWKQIPSHENGDDVLLGPITTPLVITMSDTPSHTPAPAVQEPSARNDLKGLKPSDTDCPRQDDLVSRGACTFKNCTSSCGCSQILSAAAEEPVHVGSILQECVESTTHLTLPRQDGLELTLDRETELAPLISPVITPIQTRGFVAALLREKENLPEAQPFGPEEIDYKSKDTFAPFQPAPDDPVYIIDLIHIEGSPVEIANIRAICVKHIGLFKNELGQEPARIPPFELPVQEVKWRLPKNRQAARIMSTKRQLSIRKLVETMLKGGIIVKSNASYYSQVILVPKPDGTFRFCIDYRGLNDATEVASWPIPNIRLMLGRLGNAKADTFGVIDLTAGYHQAPLALPTRIYTAFITFMGIYHFTRLPFGPKRAPSYFQEMMASIVLLGLIYFICEVYLDDIIVYGTGHEQFCTRLEQIFQRLEEKNISLKPSKVKLGMKKVEYVGKEISKEGITMSSKKIKGVTDFPMPRKMTELRSFLGLTNYFRDHVPNHSNVVAPLQKMIDHAAKKQTLLIWTDDGADAFYEVKQRIAESPLLYFIHDTAPITLMTDASDYGIGGYLYQQVGDDKQLVALVSKSLTKPQLKWSTIQKEAFALYYCCTYLDALLRDRKFTILTDHKNLTFIEKEKNEMVGRWRMALQELDYTIGYIQGKKNDIADAMSRLCLNNMEKKVGLVSSLHAIQPTTLAQHKLIDDCHNATVGHGGVQRTLRNLQRQKHSWPGMKNAIKAFIKNCPCCQKMSAIKIPVNSYTYTTSTYKPMECINIDFIGPFPDKGHILVMIDTFTRFVELYATPDATAKSACTALVEHVGRYGSPRYLRSDNGPHFANHVIDEFLKIVGTVHERILPYSSEHNAIVERMNKEINRHVRAYTYHRATTENYQEILPFVQRILNTTVNERMKISPSQLLYGNAIDLDEGILIPRGEVNLIPEDITVSSTRMINIQKELIDITAKLLKESDDLHNATQHPDITNFEVGSFVLVAQRTQPETRMHTQWRGPLRVISSNKGEYTLLNLITLKETRYHMTQLKTFLFDPQHTDPVDVARRDYLEFFIEEVIDIRGNTSSYGTLEFEVKWLNYPSENNTWEPWKSLRKTEKLHQFLISKNLRHLIPREFRLDYV